MRREPLSVCVTTLDNAATLERCLASVAWADEIVVLDSGSRDATRVIAERYGARWLEQPFQGYGPQKQAAIDRASHRWVLLLDADEALTEGSRAAIERALESPRVAGYTLPRREQVFWRLAHPRVRHARMLRLFDRTRARMGADPVHAAPETDAATARLDAPFEHFGEPDIATKVAKINAYSSGLVAHKQARGYHFVRLRMVLQPPWQFFRSYVLNRKFLSGWAGFIGAVTEAYYVFLKYAKLHEARQRDADRDA